MIYNAIEVIDMRNWYKPDYSRDLMGYVFRPFHGYCVDMQDKKWYNPLWRDSNATEEGAYRPDEQFR